MAARLNPKNQQSVRAKIQASQIVNRLQNHILGKLKKPMEDSQVRAALGLLKKVLPDLQSIEHSGDIGDGTTAPRKRTYALPDNGRN